MMVNNVSVITVVWLILKSQELSRTNVAVESQPCNAENRYLSPILPPILCHSYRNINPSVSTHFKNVTLPKIFLWLWCFPILFRESNNTVSGLTERIQH